MQEILSKIDAKDYVYMAKSSEFCSVKFGGYFEYLFLPKSMQDLCSLLSILESKQIEYKVLGNMTNIIPSDDVMRGVFVCTKFVKDIALVGSRIVASAGITMAELCNFAAKNELSGIEKLFGIPGTIGGAVFNNAGAFGQDISQTLESVLVLNRGKMHSISAKEAKMEYRSSIFQKSKQIILSATFMLHKSNKDDILCSMMGAIAKRKSSQPSDPSAGSVFKRYNNISAGKLIDDAGLKGKTIGGAQISTKHANFVVNKHCATSKDYKMLVNLAQKTVFEKFGVVLTREVEYIGETDESFGRLSHT